MPERFNYFIKGFLLCIFFTGSAFLEGYGQSSSLDPGYWASRLSDKSPSAANMVSELVNELTGKPDDKAFLNQLAARVKSNHARARFFMVSAYMLYTTRDSAKNKRTKAINAETKKELLHNLDLAIREAYESGDQYLIADISIRCGEICNFFNEYEATMMYLLNGIDLKEELGIKNQPIHFLMLSGLLYTIQEYPECIRYGKMYMDAWERSANGTDSIYMLRANNAIALGYHRQQQYDSAFYYYNIALDFANTMKDETWQGIVQGNMGQAYFLQKQYDTALSLLLTDYTISKKKLLFHNAANSLQWAARTQLALGNKTIALGYIREAFQLLKKRTDPFYERNCYYAASEIFNAAGHYDSALFYNKKYDYLKDSLDRVIALSNIKVAKIRGNDQKNRFEIQMLQRQKEKQLMQRNILIASIVVLIIMALLFFSRQKLQNQLKTNQLEQERNRILQEMTAAKERMDMFMHNIVEKTALIEKLEAQLTTKAVNAEQLELVAELSQQTILTEDDWTRFKTLFQTLYPVFFISLRQHAPDISLSEQRIAALIVLNISSKEMGAMLGISYNAVRKTRQRLRQRMQVASDEDLVKNLTLLAASTT